MKNFIVSFLEGDKIIQLLNKNYQIARELLNNRGIILPLYHVLYNTLYIFLKGFPDGSEDKASACDAGDLGLIPGLGRSPGEGNGNPLQYSCLENPMDRGALWATVHGVAKSRTRPSDFTFTFTLKS